MKRFVKWLKGDSDSRSWVRRKAVACWMNVLIAIAAAVAVVTAGPMSGQPWPAPHTLGIGALRLFTLWCLAFLPGWLYVRFLDLRALALWNEYVLNLYRLGWDTPSNLPEPSVDPAAENIYQQKFEAYYGRQITKATRDRQRTPEQKDYRVCSESLFPVFLATAVFAVGWAAVLWDTRFVTDPSGAWDVLKYGFLGAYAFVTSMLIRRFFQSDLRPSAYATAVFRIILVLLIIVVLHQVMDETSTMAYRGELAVAFVVGFFPLVGLQFLQRVTSKVLGLIVPPVTPAYPLDQLDGFNLWYEARLTEEGVEDMQNLTTMNLVDVILHTRVPPGRLVDWTDQAFLLIHLEQAGRRQLTRQRKSQGAAGKPATEGDAEPGVQARLNLRRVGIRTATDLLKAFSEPAPEPGAPWHRDFSLGGIKKPPPLPEDQLRLLVKVLAEEPGLNPVWNWQRNGVQLSPVPFQPGPRSLHAPAA